MTVADIDCASYNQVCKAFVVKNFPTFVWVEDGDVVESIPREMTVKELVSYAKKKVSYRLKREVVDLENSEGFSDNITEVRGGEFESTIASGCTLVTFCVPWCNFCKSALSTMLELQSHFSDDQTFKIVKCDCSKDVNGDTCFAELSNGVPTVNLYCNGNLVISDYHGMSFEELEDMIKSNIGDPSKAGNWKVRELDRKKKRREGKDHQHQHH